MAERDVAELALQENTETQTDIRASCAPGIPTANNTHKVAQSIVPEARVVHAGDDPGRVNVPTRSWPGSGERRRGTRAASWPRAGPPGDAATGTGWWPLGRLAPGRQVKNPGDESQEAGHESSGDPAD